MKSRTELRNHILSARFTADEWQQLERLWTGSVLSRGEWCRKMLLDLVRAVHGPSAHQPVSDLTVVLAEVLVSRTIMINLLHTLGQGQGLSAEQVRTLIERADGDKLRRALERLQLVPPKKSSTVAPMNSAKTTDQAVGE